MSSPVKVRGLTVRDIYGMKGKDKVVVVTAYDVLFAKLVDEAGVDVILVGDSAGNVVAGYDSTLPVTLDQMIYHGAAVRRGAQRACVVVDMPFLTYQTDAAHAIENCGRVLQATGAAAVKMEGGSPRIAEIIAAVIDSGIPVMGHLGFTPQSVNVLGGNRVQGRDDISAQRIINEAKRLEEAGVFSIVLELVPADVARRVTEAVSVPTIGIGAGPGCDGQVLVLPDLLGLNDAFQPKFLKRYANLAETVRSAVKTYGDEVRGGVYPDEQHSF
jgi:3-methyl-2-oxobutanoate hydroxymethyltransferase